MSRERYELGEEPLSVGSSGFRNHHLTVRDNEYNDGGVIIRKLTVEIDHEDGDTEVVETARPKTPKWDKEVNSRKRNIEIHNHTRTPKGKVKTDRKLPAEYRGHREDIRKYIDH